MIFIILEFMSSSLNILFVDEQEEILCPAFTVHYANPPLSSEKASHHHEKKVTPPKEASTWLPKVHIAIGNLKAFLNGTFHGVSHRYLQEYLDEFCYRYNRRFWEPELPHRLLNACLTHAPVTS